MIEAGRRIAGANGVAKGSSLGGLVPGSRELDDEGLATRSFCGKLTSSNRSFWCWAVGFSARWTQAGLQEIDTYRGGCNGTEVA